MGPIRKSFSLGSMSNPTIFQFSGHGRRTVKAQSRAAPRPPKVGCLRVGPAWPAAAGKDWGWNYSKDSKLTISIVSGLKTVLATVQRCVIRGRTLADQNRMLLWWGPRVGVQRPKRCPHRYPELHKSFRQYYYYNSLLSCQTNMQIIETHELTNFVIFIQVLARGVFWDEIDSTPKKTFLGSCLS